MARTAGFVGARSGATQVAMLWGALFGAADVLAVLFTRGEFSAGTGLLAVVTASIIVGAFGGVLGALLDLGWGALAALSSRFALVLLGSSMSVIGAVVFLAFPVHPPFGSSKLGAAIATAVLGLVTTAVVARFAHKRWLECTAWIACTAIAVFIAARILYPFSRLWPQWEISSAPTALMSFGHSCGLLATLALLTITTHVVLPARGVERSPSARMLAVLCVLALMACRPALDRSSNALRILLFDRTVFVYRALELVPRYRDYDYAHEPDHAPPASESAKVSTPVRKVRGVLLILVDALRADFVGQNLAGKPLTPNLDALRARSIDFATAYCTVPATEESFAAMMTGRRAAHLEPTRFATDSLGSLLHEKNVKTFGVYAHAALSGPMAELEHAMLFAGGRVNKTRLTAQITLQHVEEYLDQIPTGDAFFLLAHFYDPHSHYLHNPRYDFGDAPRDLYAAEVAYTDEYVGHLMASLEKRDLLKDTAVLLVSDHGEEIWDHGYRWHRKRIYNESARIVMSLLVPGEQPRTVATPVSLLDVTPTVLDLLGAAGPPDIDGVSLLNTDSAQVRPPTCLWAGDRSTVGLVRGSHKIIFHRFSGALEYFDLTQDPLELHNRADDEPEGVQDMLHALEACRPWFKEPKVGGSR